MEWGLKECVAISVDTEAKSLNTFQNIFDKTKVAFLKATTNIVHKWKMTKHFTQYGTTQEYSHSDQYLMYTGGPSQLVNMKINKIHKCWKEGEQKCYHL